MKIITSTDALAKLCAEFAQHSYITVDTEFLRETTFWPELCLIQIASPAEAVIVDVVSDGLSLDPFFALMANENIVKVFHAARQDIEIIYNLGGLIPHPVFDTQVAAMVCGYGDSISYDQLVYKISSVRIDKSSRFTDWKRRPLSQKQLEYALADVSHLRQVYQSLKANLSEQGRTDWVAEEMEVLTSVSTYDTPPEDAWRRLKLRVRRPRDLAVMQAVARWRELEARARNVPRGRVVRDDAIYELAHQQPESTQALAAMRSMPRGFDKSRSAQSLLAEIKAAKELPKEALPPMPKPQHSPEGTAAATEILKVLLKLVAEKHGVAAKVIATVDELERIAADDNAKVAALSGWRRELFGENALRLKRGELAIGFDGKSIFLIETGAEKQAMPIKTAAE